MTEQQMMDLIRWQEQAVTEAVNKLDVFGIPPLPARDKEMYRVGFLHGWREAVSTLKLHKLVK